MKYVSISLGVAALLSLSSCRYFHSPSLLPEDEERVAALKMTLDWVLHDMDWRPEYEVGSYEYFVSHKHYLDTLVAFRDDELLKRATADSPVYICLSQQRARLYVDGKVALDWPVSTGTEKKPTSVGRFSILEKKKEHFSGRFGCILDAEGNVLVEDADSRKHVVPPGGKWKGAEMPNWMRLTDSGIGMHTGLVVPGKRLSHGCIRMPHSISSQLFEILELKSKVYIQDAVESCFPCRDALDSGTEYRDRIRTRDAAQKELAELMQAAEARAIAAEEARERAEEEAEAKAKAERIAAREAARAERARRKAEEKAAEEARERAEEEAEAKAKAERIAAREAARAERARRKAEEKAAEEARERAEEEAEAKAKAERIAAREAARAERARRRAEEKAAEEARERAEEEAEAKAKAERIAAREAARAERARRKAEEKAAEEARERAEEEAEAKAKAERRAARDAARAERARRKAEQKAAEEARERAEEEAEAKAKAERRAAREAARAERARRKAEEKAAEEARERAEEEYEARVREQRARLRAAERAAGGGSWWRRTLRRVGL